jgi:hypothetical protein
VVNQRQNLITALEGGYLPIIPYCAYTDFITDNPSWDGLFQQGVGFRNIRRFTHQLARARSGGIGGFIMLIL